MNRLLFADPGCLNRYLAGQLSEAECEMLESQLTCDPALLREMEAAARFKAGLHRLRREGRMESIAPSRRPHCNWLRAAVAAAAVMVVSIEGFHAPASLPLLARELSVTERDQHLVPGHAQVLFRKRSGLDDVVIAAAPPVSWVELQVQPDEGLQEPYRVAILKTDQTAVTGPLASIGGLKAREGFIQVFLDSARLDPGNYRLEISGESSTSAPTSFRIRLAAEPGQ